jgi:hypothetical protein
MTGHRRGLPRAATNSRAEGYPGTLCGCGTPKPASSSLNSEREDVSTFVERLIGRGVCREVGPVGSARSRVGCRETGAKGGDRARPWRVLAALPRRCCASCELKSIHFHAPRGQEKAVVRAAFSPGGSRIVTASEDTTARLREIFASAQEFVAQAKAEAPGCLKPANSTRRLRSR